MSEKSKRRHKKYGMQQKTISANDEECIKPQWQETTWKDGMGYVPTGKIRETSNGRNLINGW